MLACPASPQPPSGASVRRTQVRSASDESPRRVRYESREPAHHGELLVTIEGTSVREDLDANIGADNPDGGSSCTNAAVFFRNIGMSGTSSIVMSSVARFRAKAWASPNVPAAA